MKLLVLGAKPKRPAGLLPLRHRRVGGEVLLTSHFGDWVFVSEDELGQLFRGELEPGSELERRLRERHFLEDSIDADTLAERLPRQEVVSCASDRTCTCWW